MGRQQSEDPSTPLVLTVTGEDSESLFDPATGVLATLRELVTEIQLKRLEVRDGNSQVRVELAELEPDQAIDLVQNLGRLFPTARS